MRPSQPIASALGLRPNPRHRTLSLRPGPLQLRGPRQSPDVARGRATQLSTTTTSLQAVSAQQNRPGVVLRFWILIFAISACEALTAQPAGGPSLRVERAALVKLPAE